MIFLSVISTALNVVFQFACVIVLGAGSATDAYFSAQAVPLLAAVVLGGALTNNLTPILARLDKTRRVSLLRATMLEYGLVVIGLFGILSGTAQWWLPVLFSGFTSSTILLAIDLARLFCGISAVQVLCAISMAGHYANERFKYVEVVQIVLLVLSLAVAALVIDKFGIVGFAWLVLIRSIALFSITSLSFTRINHSSVKDLIALLRSRMVLSASSSMIFKTGPVIDRVLASYALPGVVTSLGIGQQLVSSFLVITEKGVARRLLVLAGKDFATKAHHTVLSMYYGLLRAWLLAVTCAVLVAVPVAFILLRTPNLLNLDSLRAFDHLDLILLMALTIIPSVVGQLSSALLYALGEVRTVNRLAMVSFILSVLLKTIGFLMIGAYAIVAGIFFYQALNWMLMHLAAVRALRESPVL